MRWCRWAASRAIAGLVRVVVEDREPGHDASIGFVESVRRERLRSRQLDRDLGLVETALLSAELIVTRPGAGPLLVHVPSK